MSVLVSTYCCFCEVVSNFFKSISKAFKPSYNKAVYRQLNSLTNRELKDIGISRSDIIHIAKGGKVYRGGA